MFNRMCFSTILSILFVALSVSLGPEAREVAKLDRQSAVRPIRLASVTNQADLRSDLIRGAKAGDPLAMHNLGAFMARGEGGLPSNLAAARCWYTAAAERGSPHAAFALGLMMLKGAGGPADLATGLGFITLAADAEQPFARQWLARFRASGGKLHPNIADGMKPWSAKHGPLTLRPRPSQTPTSCPVS